MNHLVRRTTYLELRLSASLFGPSAPIHPAGRPLSKAPRCDRESTDQYRSAAIERAEAHFGAVGSRDTEKRKSHRSSPAAIVRILESRSRRPWAMSKSCLHRTSWQNRCSPRLSMYSASRHRRTSKPYAPAFGTSPINQSGGVKKNRRLTRWRQRARAILFLGWTATASASIGR